MNFLDHGKKGITFLTMIKFFAVWCAFLILLYGFLVVRQQFVQSDITRAKVQVDQLTAEKESLLRKIQHAGKKRVGTSAKQSYSSLIQNRPIWSKVISALTGSMPPQVWLDAVNVIKDDSGDRMEIRGRAKSQRALTNFMMNVEASPVFSATALVHTKLSEKVKGELSYEMVTRPQPSGL